MTSGYIYIYIYIHNIPLVSFIHDCLFDLSLFLISLCLICPFVWLIPFIFVCGTFLIRIRWHVFVVVHLMIVASISFAGRFWTTQRACNILRISISLRSARRVVRRRTKAPRQLREPWLRTNGVNTNGRNFDRSWKVEKGTPWHRWESKSKLMGVPERSLCQKTWNSQWPHYCWPH